MRSDCFSPRFVRCHLTTFDWVLPEIPITRQLKMRAG
jgi:hypothetical protein